MSLVITPAAVPRYSDSTGVNLRCVLDMMMMMMIWLVLIQFYTHKIKHKKTLHKIAMCRRAVPNLQQ